MNFKEWLIAEEGNYGLFEAASYEKRLQKAIADAQAIAKFYHNNDKRYPSKNSQDKLEKSLGKSFDTLKQRKKQQQRANTFIGSMWEKAEQAGIKARLPKNWMDAADLSLEGILKRKIAYAQAIAEFYHNNDKRYPSVISSNKEEKSLGKSLDKLKQDKKRQLRANDFIGSIYEKVEQAGIKARLPKNWMDAADKSLESRLKQKIATAQAIAKFYKKNDKRYPNGKSPNEEEKSLATKLNRLRQDKKTLVNDNKFIGSIWEKAEQAGIDAELPPDWMDVTDLSLEGILKRKIAYAQAIAKFYHNNDKRYPSKDSPNEEEKLLGWNLKSFKQDKKNLVNDNKFIGSIYEKVEQAGIKARLPKNWMDVADVSVEGRLKQKIAAAQAIAEFYHNNDKRYPSGESPNKEEKYLGNKLYTLRQDKKRLKQLKQFTGSIYEEAEKAGITARLPLDWMDVGNATPKKFVNHQALIRILKNLKLAENFNFQPEMVCFREGKSCLRYDGAYKDNQGNPIAVFEYQGEQHYHPTTLSGLRRFLKGEKNDSDKLNITRQNNIPLLSIPFWKKNQMESLVNEFIKDVLNAPNNKLSPSKWNHYAVDIATPDAQQQEIIDKEFCKYFNSPKGNEDSALAALYPEIKKKWKMCQNNK